MYSQSNEEQLIINYFGEKRVGTLLSLGENNGKDLSNVLAAIMRGWSAVLVEPSKTAFGRLEKLHAKNPNVICYNVAIGEKNGAADFYESGEHLGSGDTSLISTLKQSETEKWKGSKFDNFTLTKANVQTWESFYSKIPVKTFNLISVDCEGLDLFILQQMDLKKMGCEMLIIEWNGNNFTEFTSIAEKFGMSLYDKNAENLIFVK